MAKSDALNIHADGTVCVGAARLDPLRWRLEPGAPDAPGRPATAREAMAALSRQVALRHLVLGVIGPREASATQVAAAEAVGRQLAGFGITLICGGRSGVMEAVCRGCTAAGGLAIGLLPGNDPDEANAFVGIPLPTGLSEGRNMVIARAARALIAVGGSYGTLSEVAYGLHFGKAVIGLEGAPEVAGLRHAESVDAAVDLALAALIASARPTELDQDV
jgi:uncharacterized protein (TIGR00725 family)